ncbi:MAG TPA: efflux RND transporter permease subunit [Vicinamibacteria bacterium]|nr:efflux RND transporter permease subunit [Vicinamibacteria bacterium]
MSLPKLAVSRPVTSFMLLVSIVVVGAISARRLPLAFLPTLDIPFVGVTVPYPNSNPTQVEKTIARPLEEAFATLPDVKRLRSTSDADGCQVQMEFQWGLDLDVVRMLVREKLDQARPRLPRDIGEIQVFSFNTTDIPIVQARVSAPGVDLSQNYDLLEQRIANRIRRVPGVARVTLDGVEPRQIWIDMRLARLKAHRVDLGQVVARLQTANATLALGTVSQDGRTYSARALGSLDSLDQIRLLAVDAQGLRLGDIADVRYEEPPVGHGRRLNGEKAVAVEIFKESTANTVQTVEAVQKVITEEIAQDPLLNGVSLFTWEDQAREIRGGIEGLTSAGLQGGLLALLVLYFFLRRWDSTFIVSAAIPISLLATTAVMYFSGRNLNVLSMMGLMLGVGMLVDNAIVVLESIDRRHRQDPDVRRSALEGGTEVAMAIAASTLTSVIVFLPLIVGQKNNITIMLGEAGFTIAVALLASLVVSLILIPLLAASVLRARRTSEPRAMAFLEERYARALRWTLRHRAWTFAGVVAALVLAFVPLKLKLVETSTFSGGVNRRLFMRYQFADFAYKSDVERAVRRVEDYLFSNKDEFLVRDVYSFFGENEGFSTLVLSEEDLPDPVLKELRQKIRKGLPPIPGVKVLFENDSEEGGSTTYFSVKLYGNDVEGLTAWAETVSQRLDAFENVEDVTTSTRRGRKEIQARLDTERARRLGLQPRDVADVFSFTLGGLRLARFNAGEREVEMNLSLALEDRENLADLKELVVATREGRPVTLAEVADFQVVTRAQSLQRENRKLRVQVNAAFEGKEFGPAREKIAAMMDSLGLPPGISWSFNDRIQEQDEQGKQMALNYLLALALVYIVMASLFESLAQPFAILFSIPFSLLGATWLLAATGTPFNLMAQLGVLILMGIVVNNGIVLLDRVNQYRAQGLSREDAIERAGRDRLRPILMTAMTTILGLLPLALGKTGLGGWAYYYPLARTVMGGLLSSTVLTLVVLPFISDAIERFAEWAGRVWSASGPMRPVKAPSASVSAS